MCLYVSNSSGLLLFVYVCYMLRLARKRSVRRGSGAPDADGPGACISQPLGVVVDSLVFIHLIIIDHKIRMVINRLNHLCQSKI
jgi:hypothetical protein